MTGHPLINAILTASPENPLEVKMSVYLKIKRNHSGIAYQELTKMLAEHSAFIVPDIPQPMAAPVARGY
ncbi:MAG: hypothetical protein O0X96_05625 [Methanocorpusculum sp.]|nr:hypothetical protein [Methanocorpusculum sp.]MDE2524590.1 hypothetical protein [Methanocorpusculum sp.]